MNAQAPYTIAALAYARSGDKGDVSNIGLLAKDSTAYAMLGLWRSSN